MKIIYQAIDGKNFDVEENCIEYENNLLKIKEIFRKLVDAYFFRDLPIKNSPYHNIHDFNNPFKNDFNINKHGYLIYGSGFGDYDIYIIFKLRNNKLIALFYDEDENNYDFIMNIYLDKIFKEEYRNKKIKKI